MRSAFALTALLCALANPSLLAAYDYDGTPVGSLILLHSTSQIQAQIAAGWRPTSLTVEGVASGKGSYRVNYIQNIGSHHRTVKFVGEATPALIDLWRSSGYFIEDVAVVGGKLSAILIANSGTAARTTGYFYGWTAEALDQWLDGHTDYRLLDLDRYATSGTYRYSGVVLRNVGSAAVSGWGWSPSMTFAQLGAWEHNNGMRIIDLEQRSDGRYVVVFAKRLPNQRYYYFGGKTLSEVLELLGGVGLRCQTLNETTLGGVKRYSGTAVNNVGAQAARLGDLVVREHDGVQGFYLEQVNGPRLVDLNAERSMYPSSTIKVLLHYYAVYTTPTASLGTRSIGGQSLTSIVSQMMWNSNNSMANLLYDAFGPEHVAALARSTAGMSTATALHNHFGDGPWGDPPRNSATLVDLGRIYRAVQLGIFNPTKDAYFRTNMLNETLGFPWGGVLASVRDQIHIGDSQYSDYFNRIHSLLKAGNNTDSSGANAYWSVAGVLRLPVKSPGGAISSRDYLFGHYVNRSTKNYDDGWTATAEIVREQIKETMLTFK